MQIKTMSEFKFPISITFIALLVIFCAPFKSTSFGMWPFSEEKQLSLERAREIYNEVLNQPNIEREEVTTRVSELLFEELWREEQNNRQNQITRILGITAGGIAAGAMAMGGIDIKSLCEMVNIYSAKEPNLLISSIMSGGVSAVLFKKIFAKLLYDHPLLSAVEIPALLNKNDYQYPSEVLEKMSEYNNITARQDLRMDRVWPLTYLGSFSFLLGIQLSIGGLALKKIADLNSVLFVLSIIYSHALIPLSIPGSVYGAIFMGSAINSVLWNDWHSAEISRHHNLKTIALRKKRYDLKGFRDLLKKETNQHACNKSKTT